MVRRILVMLILFVVSGIGSYAEDFRPPAVPLVACDPYFSIWACADTLAGDVTRHWTGRPHPLTSLVRVDGKAYRLMGEKPEGLPALRQVRCMVLPTQTVYRFEGAGVRVTMTFLQAALPHDIDLVSSPVVYLSWEAASLDGKEHDASVYFDAGMELVVNEPSQEVVWSRKNTGDLEVLKAGSKQQNILGRKGDNVRIDWGYFYLATSKNKKLRSGIVQAGRSRMQFVGHGTIPTTIEKESPKRVDDDAPVMAMQFDLDTVGSRTAQSCYVLLAYDDLYSIRYFGRDLKAYWKRNGKTIEELLMQSAGRYDRIARQAARFDAELMSDLKNAGGEAYQKIGALAYRQALAANKIVVDGKGMPLMLSKENFSNGCMGTVDVFYPFSPLVILLNPALAKASFVPIFEYGRSERWKFPFAPHDIGTYPHATGQAYGGGERSEKNQMPVEECGNMILLVAAVVEAEDDISFARSYWDIVSVWAKFLKSKGFDPENQLCTDDFAGHLAHNVNLSLKAIVALGAYAKMAGRMGEEETAASYRKIAEEYVKKWMQKADDGDHYRLAFDRPGTWSQKYNLIWDRVLNLKLFPKSVAEKEVAYYKKVQNTYGLPLDNRSKYTKLDWILWTASITGKQKDFEALIDPVLKFLNQTPDRVPMTDWYFTHNARRRGFQARPVVGGVFIRLLDNRKVWKKWASRAEKITGTWASLPKPPKIIDVVPTSVESAKTWWYTFRKPGETWSAKTFDARADGWKQGPGGFGTRSTPGVTVRTRWNTNTIWVRRTFMLENVPDELMLYVHHDEDAEVYINGERAAVLSGYTTSYQPAAITTKALKTLSPGKNAIAIHCHQTAGGQYIDAGLVQVIPQE